MAKRHTKSAALLALVGLLIAGLPPVASAVDVPPASRIDVPKHASSAIPPTAVTPPKLVSADERIPGVGIMLTYDSRTNSENYIASNTSDAASDSLPPLPDHPLSSDANSGPVVTIEKYERRAKSGIQPPDIYWGTPTVSVEGIFTGSGYRLRRAADSAILDEDFGLGSHRLMGYWATNS